MGVSYHDAARHLEYLRQSLSQDNKPIGFFLSAGCPLSVEMKDGKWPLIPDIKGLTEWVRAELKDDATFKILIKELEKAEIDINNIEDILSFIRDMLQVAKGNSIRGFTESQLKNLEKNVCKKIVKKMDVLLPNKETPFHILGKWISSIDRKIPIEIFTTNYDMLIEQALEYLEVPYFDGFVGSRRAFFDLRAVVESKLIPEHWTRYWKIHGSINWYLEELNGQKKIYRSSEIKEDESHLIYPSHLKYEQSRKMPYLALIDQLGNFIRQTSSFLIISGYSFNDEHINNIIINALKSNPTAMALGLMNETYMKKNNENELSERYPQAYKHAKNQHNLNIWTYDVAIIGTNKCEWKKCDKNTDEDILDFIKVNKREENSDIETTQIKLGDFSLFTKFLKTLIGANKEYQNDK